MCLLCQYKNVNCELFSGTKCILNICLYFKIIISIIDQGSATHGITGASFGGSRAANYHFISFFLSFVIKKLNVKKLSRFY